MNASLTTWLPWVQALGWTLLHFIWQGLVVGIGFGAVRALLPKTHCHARYAAGLVALAALAAWPLATFIALQPQTSATALAIASPLLSDAGAGAITDGTGVAALAPIDHLLPLLVFLWSAGVMLMAARALREWRALARVAREWAQSSAELDVLMTTLARRFGFLRRIRVLVSPRIDTPMLIGWLKPIVLLPTAVALGFPQKQLELILAHELGHLRRYDHLVNLAQALLETLLFYHPVVHWISREVRNERELCCDVLVLRLTRGEPREYARTLAALEELRQPSRLALAASGGVLIERVRRIVGMPAPRFGLDRSNPARWLLVASAFALAVTLSLRIDRGDEMRYVSGLTVDWLAQPAVRMLPIAALTLPFERPHLRLAAMAPPAPARSSAVPAAMESSPAPVVVVAAPAASLEASSQRRTSTLDASLERHKASLTVPVPAVTTAPAATTKMPAVATSATPTTVSAPVPTHIVMPRFPSSARNPNGQVDASFRIDASGFVQDVRVSSQEAGATFAQAAEHALRQWRFDPKSVSADRSRLYRQSFVFSPPTTQNRRSESSCTQSTGTHICRSPEDSAPVTTLIINPPG